ncbi:hypothetical protein C9374_008940 [Naegleria lovaniensis]|uniref:Alternative oxidase n=1 Tax=Naegleria lovaniensis TaxID=51637 RepID=A0AA88GJC2_NAELO|nr:uncharacterized protein C9374_008940 [Naegleria lovaniensis]KAG2377855.1 hypothetical protein C9374_008940 [Naegleria lovaniensis]
MKQRSLQWASSNLFKRNINFIKKPLLGKEATSQSKIQSTIAIHSDFSIHSSFSFHTHSTLFAFPLKATANPNTTSTQPKETHQLDVQHGAEIQQIITEHYNAHTPLFVSTGRNIEHGPYLDTKQLESNYITERKPLKGFSEYLAYSIVRCIKGIIHAFFGKNYIHHALCLEAIASIPGVVMGTIKHYAFIIRLRRTVSVDSSVMFDEAENENMHLMIWTQITSPTFVEQEAIQSYTQLLEDIDSDISRYSSIHIPEVALKYYNLDPVKSELRDLVLAIRADECHHRDFHRLKSYWKEDLQKFSV